MRKKLLHDLDPDLGGLVVVIVGSSRSVILTTAEVDRIDRPLDVDTKTQTTTTATTTIDHSNLNKIGIYFFDNFTEQ